ncbi:MFS transporter [Stutzerimonas urumqiensis]|uniref:MFS transporter n=1 Tax=Stutzerimonas urumqiensis TaxID=638269 RepID=UPI003BA9D300
MDALLILSGLLLMLAGLVWLISLAFQRSLLWGCASLLPPGLLLYLFRDWNRARRAMLVFCLGFVPLIVGVSLLANRDAERFAALLSLQWLRLPADETGQALTGTFRGESFAPTLAELEGRTLTLRQGAEGQAMREVTIQLPEEPGNTLRLGVLPTDRGALPVVELRWRESEFGEPKVQRFDRGYTLHLGLTAEAPRTMAGDFHLVLPPALDTNLSGQVKLASDALAAMPPDRTVDSDQTLAYVVLDHLQRRYATERIELAPLPPVQWPATQVRLTVDARIDGQARRLTLELTKATDGWQVSTDGQRAKPARVAASAVPETPQAPRASRDDPLLLETVIRHPERFLHQRLRAHTERGGVASGTFAGLDAEGRLSILRSRQGSGQAAYILSPGEIVLLELLD